MPNNTKLSVGDHDDITELWSRYLWAINSGDAKIRRILD